MSTFLGLDLGEKRIGVALSDEEGKIAEALTTLGFKHRKRLRDEIIALAKEHRAEKIVVGLPETEEGKIGPSARKVIDLVEWLKARVPVEWILWDERFTTQEAEAVLLEADLGRKRRKEVRDRLAAQRILQSYLDDRNRK